MSLFIILSRHSCHLLISNGFELLCNVCYWKFLLIIFAVSLHHQALLSCGANCYFSKLEYQSFLVQSFWKKLKIINFQSFSHSWSLKCRTFLRMTHTCFLRNITKSFRRVTSQNTTFGIFFFHFWYHFWYFFPLYCQFVAATYFFITLLNLSEIVKAQVKFIVPEVVASLSNCQYDPLCREFQSADSTWPCFRLFCL